VSWPHIPLSHKEEGHNSRKEKTATGIPIQKPVAVYIALLRDIALQILVAEVGLHFIHILLDFLFFA